MDGVHVSRQRLQVVNRDGRRGTSPVVLVQVKGAGQLERWGRRAGGPRAPIQPSVGLMVARRTRGRGG